MSRTNGSGQVPISKETLNIQPLQIAIDGPVAAGKGDIASRLAQELGLLYVYTGAMYRALALACLRQGISLKDEAKVISLLGTTGIDLLPSGPNDPHPYKVILNQKDVTEQIFRQEVAMGASDVSTIARVRVWMVSRQQEIAQGKSVVVEGRDIGLRVLPKAQLKIYLTAAVEERAKRRWLQFKERGIDQNFAEVLADTQARDLQDTTRTVDPLRKLPDAWELDTTDLNQAEVVAEIKQELQRRHLV